MKIRGMSLILAAIAGALFVCTYDILAGKAVNDITGPKSIAALAVCGIILLMGIVKSTKESKKAGKE